MAKRGRSAVMSRRPLRPRDELPSASASERSAPSASGGHSVSLGRKAPRSSVSARRRVLIGSGGRGQSSCRRLPLLPGKLLDLTSDGQDVDDAAVFTELPSDTDALCSIKGLDGREWVGIPRARQLGHNVRHNVHHHLTSRRPVPRCRKALPTSRCQPCRPFAARGTACAGTRLSLGAGVAPSKRPIARSSARTPAEGGVETRGGAGRSA